MLKKFLKTIILSIVLFLSINPIFAALESPEDIVALQIENVIKYEGAGIAYPEMENPKFTFQYLKNEINRLTIKSMEPTTQLTQEEQVLLNDYKAKVLLLQLRPIIEDTNQNWQKWLWNETLYKYLKEKKIVYKDGDYYGENYYKERYDADKLFDFKTQEQIDAEVASNSGKTTVKEKDKLSQEDQKKARRLLTLFFGTDSPIFFKTKTKPEGIELTSFEYTALEFAFNILLIGLVVASLLLVLTISFWQRYNDRMQSGMGGTISWKFLRVKELAILIIFILFIFSGILWTVFFAIYFDMLKEILNNLFGGFGDTINLK